MIHSIKSNAVRVIMGVLLLIFLGISSYPAILFQDIDQAIQDESSQPVLRKFPDTEIASGLYAKSYSFYMDVLYQIDMSTAQGTDFSVLKSSIRGAIDAMNQSLSYYTALIRVIDNQGYNRSVIHDLKTFNYGVFRVSHNLNSNVFKDVKFYLSKGDIRGLIVNFISQSESILNLLESADQMLRLDKFPDTELMWQITSQYAESFLYGQYASQVFVEVNR